MAYLNSGDILVFPTVARANEYQRQSRLMTEESLTRYFKTMWNNGSFVISSLSDVRGNNQQVSNGTLEFVIGGYYVKVDDFSTLQTPLALSTNGTYTLYASINLSTTNGYAEIDGEDDNGSYTGVTFTAVASNGSEPSGDFVLRICTISFTSSTFQCTSVNDFMMIDGGDEQ